MVQHVRILIHICVYIYIYVNCSGISKGQEGLQMSEWQNKVCNRVDPLNVVLSANVYLYNESC